LANGKVDVTFQQIGGDQGLLPEPAALTVLTLLPGERADVLVDFSGLAGAKVILHSQTSQLMQFRVAAGTPHPERPLPAKLHAVPRIDPKTAVRTRRLTLGQTTDERMRMRMLLDGKRWSDPVSERPALDTVEIWELMNVTEEMHPIHLHLVRFQILDRQKFNTDLYEAKGELELQGPALPPDPNEMGWKDTVRAFPLFVTRIIARFEGFAGRYVWHCHVLEHAANEMMRPFEVIARSP
jgi:spore coat protein A